MDSEHCRCPILDEAGFCSLSIEAVHYLPIRVTWIGKTSRGFSKRCSCQVAPWLPIEGIMSTFLDLPSQFCCVLDQGNGEFLQTSPPHANPTLVVEL